MKVVFFGTPQFAIPSLEMLLKDNKFQVLGVITQPDKRRGRGSLMTPSPVKQLALVNNIQVWQPLRTRQDENLHSYLQSTKADVFVVVAYGQILPASLLKIPRLGSINLHASILPQYRGAAPIQWCIYNGESETGNTTMLMNEGMDTGDILLKSQLSIDLFENANQVAEKLSLQGAQLLKDTLLGLEEKTLQPLAQESNLASYAPMLKREDFLLNWSRSALQLHNQIRGLYPNCFTTFRGDVLKIISSRPLDSALSKSEICRYPENLEPGEISLIFKNEGPVIFTGDGFLLLEQVQVAGKKIQSAWDFVNGMHIQPREKLG